MKFKFSDLVEFWSKSGYTIKGTVTRLDSDEFFVKWDDGCVSTEPQDTTDNIRKVDSAHAR